jgi:predicted transcriptional regulator
MTPRQREALDAICRYRLRRGRYPTCRELAEVLGCTEQPVHKHLRALRQEGYLEAEPGRSRAYRVTVWPAEVLGLALPA